MSVVCGWFGHKPIDIDDEETPDRATCKRCKCKLYLEYDPDIGQWWALDDFL